MPAPIRLCNGIQKRDGAAGNLAKVMHNATGTPAQNQADRAIAPALMERSLLSQGYSDVHERV